MRGSVVKSNLPVSGSVALIANYFSEGLYSKASNFYQKLPSLQFLLNITLPAPIPDKEKKLTEIFILKLLFGASKGFMKTF